MKTLRGKTKQFIAVLLLVAIFMTGQGLSVLAETAQKATMQNEQTETMQINAETASQQLSNPRTDANGVVTWDCVYFGNYPQSDATGATSEPIKWRVLQVNGNDAFLQADVNLDCQPYNETRTDVTWETCTLRSWLNNTFLNKAFTASEQSAITTTNVVNEDNPDFGTEGGNNTNDKVFLLSLNEVIRNAAYGFSTDWDERSATRRRVNTAYAKAQGAYTYESYGTGYWWLRSPGDDSDFAAIVSFSGWVDQDGCSVDNEIGAVCPALHLNLSSTGVYSYAGTVTSEGGSSGGNVTTKLSNPRTDANGAVTWDCVYFGNYPQSDATGATSEPIKWRVLQVNGNDAFLQADVNLDCQLYNDTYTDVTWETCTLRSWLNNTFLNKAFTASEQSAITTTNVVNEDNPEYGTEGGNNTNDKVFLLSLNEVRNAAYGFSTDWDERSATRRRVNTAYAKAQGADTFESYGTGWWWLRSPAYYSSYAAGVSFDGWVSRVGGSVDGEAAAVCPALHLNLSSTGVYSYAGTVTSEGGSSGGNVSNQVQTPTASIKSGCYTIGQSVTLSTTTSGAKIYYTIDGSEPTTESILYTTPVMIPSSMTLKAIAVKDGMENSTVMTENYQVGAAASSVQNKKVPVNDINFLQGLSADIKDASYGKFFPGNWNLKSTMIPAEAKMSYDEDGNYTIRISIGIGRSDVLDSDTKWCEYKKNLEKGFRNRNRVNVMEAFSKRYNTITENFMEKTPLSAKPEISFAGYGELKFDKFGNQISSSGGVLVNAKWEGGMTKQFWTPIGPVYLSLKGGASLKGELAPKYVLADKKLNLTGSVELAPSISLEGGYGIDKFATIGAKGEAKLPTKLKWEPKFSTTVDLKATASLHVYLVWVIDCSYDLGTYTLSIYGKDNSLIKSNKLSPEFMGDDTMVLIPVGMQLADDGYAAKTTEWNGGSQSMFVSETNSVSVNTLTDDATQKASVEEKDVQNLSGNETATEYFSDNTDEYYLADATVENTKMTLQSYILPNTVPVMEKIGTDTVAVFQAKDSDRSSLNSIKLMSSVYRAGSWSVPQEISAEATLDSYADLSVFNDKLYLIWQKEKYRMTAEDEADLEQAAAKMAEGFEIYTAVYDPAQNCFVNETALTADEQLDMSAALSKDGNKLSSVWVKNSDSDLTGTAGTNSIVAADYDESNMTWKTPYVISESTNMIDSVVPFYRGDTLYVAYRENSVQEESIFAQRIRLYNTETGQSVSVADSLKEAALTDIQYLDGILYYKDNSVLKAYDVTGETTTVLEPEEGSFGANAKVYANGTKKAVLYSDAEGGCVYSSVLTEEGCSVPVAIYETADGETIDFVSGELLSDGSWQLMLTEKKQTAEEEVSSLVFVSRREETDLSLDAAYVNEYMTDGQNTKLEAIVTNKGEKSVTQVVIKLADDSNTYLDKTVDVSIAPGETVSLEEYADLSMLTQKTALTVDCHAPQETNVSDNTAVCYAGLTDVAVLSTMVKSDGKAYIAVTAQNNSNTLTETTVSIYNQTENGEKVAEYSFGAIAANETANHTFEVPLDEIVYSNDDAAYYLVKAETDVDDYDMDNNQTIQVIYADDTKEAPLLDADFFANVSTDNNRGNTTTSVAVSFITIKAPSKKLAGGKKVQFSAELAPNNATNKAVTWTSSNPKYATVDANGMVSFKKAGAGKSVTITATAKDGSGKSASYKVKIMKDAVKKIKLSAQTKTVKAGKSIKIKAAVTTTGKKANKSLKWTSSNTAYATVNAKGKVVTKKAGKGKRVTITAEATDGSNKKAKIKLKIK